MHCNHGIEALAHILERQHTEKSDIREQYNSFKEYAFDLIAEKKAIKAVAIFETAVCLECDVGSEVIRPS